MRWRLRVSANPQVVSLSQWLSYMADGVSTMSSDIKQALVLRDRITEHTSELVSGSWQKRYLLSDDQRAELKAERKRLVDVASDAVRLDRPQLYSTLVQSAAQRELDRSDSRKGNVQNKSWGSQVQAGAERTPDALGTAGAASRYATASSIASYSTRHQQAIELRSRHLELTAPDRAAKKRRRKDHSRAARRRQQRELSADCGIAIAAAYSRLSKSSV